jgi:hypothetical protein
MKCDLCRDDIIQRNQVMESKAEYLVTNAIEITANGLREVCHDCAKKVVIAVFGKIMATNL